MDYTRHPHECESIEHARKQAVRAAKELGYSKDIIKTLNTASTSEEIASLLRKGRIECFK